MRAGAAGKIGAMPTQTMTLTDTDIANIERTTLEAVAPADVEEIENWLLPFDDSNISRAKSAVHARHHPLDIAQLVHIEALYAARGLRAAFRIADVATTVFSPVGADPILTHRGCGPFLGLLGR